MSLYLESARTVTLSLVSALFCTALLLAASAPHVAVV